MTEHISVCFWWTERWGEIPWACGVRSLVLEQMHQTTCPASNALGRQASSSASWVHAPVAEIKITDWLWAVRRLLRVEWIYWLRGLAWEIFVLINNTTAAVTLCHWLIIIDCWARSSIELARWNSSEWVEKECDNTTLTTTSSDQRFGMIRSNYFRLIKIMMEFTVLVGSNNRTGIPVMEVNSLREPPKKNPTYHCAGIMSNTLLT